MYFTLKRKDSEHTITDWLPCFEKDLQGICDKLNIENDMKTKVEIVEVVNFSGLTNMLKDIEVNLEELNFFMKYYKSLSQRDIKTLYAVADAKKIDNMKDLINLEYNTSCYNLVDECKNLNELGKELYLHEHESMELDIWEKFDGKSYVKNIVKNNTNHLDSMYGKIYPNNNKVVETYNGKTFPLYWCTHYALTMRFETDTDTEYLYLPCEKTEIDKAVERLGVDNISKAKLLVEDCDWSEKIKNIIFSDFSLKNLNKFAELFEKHDSANFLENFVDAIDIQTTDELEILLKAQYEFEFIPNVHDTSELEKYITTESGSDENNIDFNKYGMDKSLEESGVFTTQGYLAYKGYNKDMINILNKKLNMNLDNTFELQEMKLYVHLKIESCDEEISSQELVDYEDEITDYLKKFQKDLPERGLMEDYFVKDVINSKVQSYELTVETVKGELMGVMLLQLNAPLTEKELEKFKSSEKNQLRTGIGYKIEQQEITCGNKNYNICFWNRDRDWEISTLDELELNKPVQTQGFTMKGF
ncbi:MAG: hypothetical protein R3Y35_11280 [Clostridia bacterium]